MAGPLINWRRGRRVTSRCPARPILPDCDESRWANHSSMAADWSIGWIAGFGQAGSAVIPFMTGALASKYGIQSLQPLQHHFTVRCENEVSLVVLVCKTLQILNKICTPVSTWSTAFNNAHWFRWVSLLSQNTMEVAQPNVGPSYSASTDPDTLVFRDLATYLSLARNATSRHRTTTRSAQRCFIFDLLLSAGGVKNPDTLFPPHNVSGLERLLGVIETSNYDTLKKECLIYWLLKWHTDGREARFSEDRCIPPQFVRAVSILSDPRLNRDFVSKILHAISTSPDASLLILKYVRTAKPILTEPDDIDLYANALAESSFLEAWQHQRTFGETDLTRERYPEDVRPGAASHFPYLPLRRKATNFHCVTGVWGRQQSYLSQLPTLSRLSQIVLQDLICTRLIQCGRYTEAIKIDKEFAANSAASPTSIRDDDASLIQSRIQERNRMMREVYSTLTPAERNLLDVEMDGRLVTAVLQTL
ncbi:Protein transport protein [Salix suchowensis]|nr:Protein transport protein [Salix suchowensis]